MSIALPTGGNVIGAGTDIVDVARIRSAHQRHKDRFLARIYTASERDYCFSMADPYPHLAARFAAKEAISKAFSTGIGKHLGWKSASIAKGGRGQPIVLLDEQGRALLAQVGASEVLVSLSHTATLGSALALLVKHTG